ncbi:ENO [Mytilus coruscus]|uniref:2-phospho-D-glycerate hydro-lyase n=1 Tax=Mytilus coruscus TaxID=42192 RepID=A0A6J8BFI1_MYTCO|nr:ENO [Mytilus coruscus]
MLETNWPWRNSLILPTGMYRSIKQGLSHAGNKLAMQEFMILPTEILILPTGMYGSIKQELSHAGNKLAMQNSCFYHQLVRIGLLKQNLVMLATNWPCRNSLILPTGTGSMYRSIKQELVMLKQTGHAEFLILPTGIYRSIKQGLSHAGNKLAMQEFMILTGMYRSYKARTSVMLATNWHAEFMILPLVYKQELSHAGNKLAMQEFMILPTGIYRSYKTGLQSCWQQTGHAGIHDSTNWSIKQELSHAGNKLAMQEFMILPTGMYGSIKQELQSCWKQTGHDSTNRKVYDSTNDSTNWSIKQELSHMGLAIKFYQLDVWVYKQGLSHAGNKLAMQEFMILPTELSHAGNKLAMQLILPTGMYRSIKQNLVMLKQTGHAGIHDSTNWSIKQNFSHAGNKLAMQEFMILPTGMYRSIKQGLSHAGNKLAMQEFMILPTGMYRSIKQELSHAGNKHANS